jgi:hypothetical protein
MSIALPKLLDRRWLLAVGSIRFLKGRNTASSICVKEDCVEDFATAVGRLGPAMKSLRTKRKTCRDAYGGSDAGGCGNLKDRCLTMRQIVGHETHLETSRTSIDGVGRLQLFYALLTRQ